VTRQRLVTRGPEREVWDVELDDCNLVLTVFLPGDRSSVNTSLPPAAAARKCHLAMTELAAHGVPTPEVIGSGTWRDASAVATRRENVRPWLGNMRVEAAELLGRLHGVPIASLSAELAALARCSDARQHRVLVGLRAMAARLDHERPGWRAQHRDVAQEEADLREEPVPRLPPCLVHGDYFSANLLATESGLVVVDWETLAVGDPMGDLGWLVGVDQGLSEPEAESVTKSYAAVSPVDERRLEWWRRCWAAFWRMRVLTS
jgi:aminoglycoside phosphotransferase (APT) family kinase protein